MRSEQEEALERFMEVVGKQAERAAAYTKSVIAVGYAVVLAAWGFAGTWMPPTAHAVAGFLLISSVVIFVMWEVHANISMASKFAQIGALVNRSDSQGSLRAIQEYTAASQRKEFQLGRAWQLTLVATIATGLSGASVILISVVLHLVQELRGGL